MAVFSLNDGWEYAHLGESDFKKISLPHDAMLFEPRSDFCGGKHVGYFAGRDYIYRLRFKLDKSSARKFILEFEGVYKDARVRLNGREVCSHDYGYTGFFADVTDFAADGENLLEVGVFNSDAPNSRYYSGAGIYRPVWLHALPERHILPEGIKVETLDYALGKIAVSVATSHGGNFTAVIYDGARAVASASGEGKVEMRIPEVKLWGPAHPHLYSCSVSYAGGVQAVDFGVRQLEWSAKKGFCINGERVILRGACIHHDNGILGACAYPDAEERKIRLLLEAGYNAVRSAHNPCSKALLNAADRLGMLVVEEYADTWYIHKTAHDYADRFADNWSGDLTDMVNRDFNHPSVVMYSIGNEVSETAEKRGVELSRDMRAVILAADGTRPVTCAVNVFFNFLSRLGFGVYSDEKALLEARAKKRRERAVGSTFFNELAGALGGETMKRGARLFGCDLFSRKHFAEMDVAGYNYGILRYKRDLKKYPDRIILGSETFVKDAYLFYDLAKRYPAIIGDFVWAGMDYLGEVGVGAHEYADYAANFSGDFGWISAGSGRLDLTGRETAEALYTKAVFGIIPIGVAVVPVNGFGKKHSPSAWKMTNARSSWSWNGCEGKKTQVEVYSRAHTVKLFLNSRAVGARKTGANCRALFKVKYERGELRAVGFDRGGNEICSAYLSSASDKTLLTLTPETPQAKRGGLLFVRLAYTDERGIIKPLERGEISLRVEGGRLLGFGNACPYNERGYLSDVSDTYYGEALAVVSPIGGEVKLFAKSKFGCAQLCVPVV